MKAELKIPLVVGAYLEARRGYLKASENLDKLLITLTAAFLPILGWAVYHAEYESKTGLFIMIPLVVALYGLFYSYERAQSYMWRGMALDIDRKLGEILGDRGVMMPESWPKRLLSVEVFNIVLIGALVAVFLFGSFRVSRMEWPGWERWGYVVLLFVLLALNWYSGTKAHEEFERMEAKVSGMAKRR
jgi:hypothetical protein